MSPTTAVVWPNALGWRPWVGHSSHDSVPESCQMKGRNWSHMCMLNPAPNSFLNANSNTYICTIIYLVTWPNYEHLPLFFVHFWRNEWRLFMYVQCTGHKHFYSANMPEYSRYTCYKISAFLLKSPAKCAKKPLLPSTIQVSSTTVINIFIGWNCLFV